MNPESHPFTGAAVLGAEVIYLHPSMFPSWDFHIRKGIITDIQGEKFTIDPSRSRCFGHEVQVEEELLNPAPEYIDLLRAEGKRIENFRTKSEAATKSITETFTFLCSNATYHRPQATLEEKKRQAGEDPALGREYWALQDTRIPCLLCPLQKFEDFVQEKYDYDKHLAPVISAKLVWMPAFKNPFPEEPERGKIARRNHGTANHAGTLYIEFFLGERDPNENHTTKNFWL